MPEQLCACSRCSAQRGAAAGAQLAGRRPLSRRARGLVTAGFTLGALLVVGGVVGLSLNGPGSGATVVSADTPGQPETDATSADNSSVAILDPGTPTENPSAAQAIADTGKRFLIASVGLSVPLGAINAADGELTPPGFKSAYWVRNIGVSPERASMGTVFVVMHSVRGGGNAPGNALTDVAAKRAAVKRGEIIMIDNVSYTITGTELVDRTKMATDAEVWADTPYRLVVITCLEKPDNSEPTQNLVIEATRSSR